MINTSLILSALPKKVLDFITEMNGAGWYLTLVGGSVRDYFLHSKFTSNDFDFEIRPIENKNITDLENWLKTNHSKYPFLKQNFGVWIFDTDEISLEISIPRIEKYQGDGPFKHRDFDCVLGLGLDYKTSFLRRDFTINSIGIEFRQEGLTLIDPYSGLESLKQRFLKTVNPHFSNDPVRYLRAFRFAQNLNFQFDQNLKEQLAHMSLKHLTPFYFFKEVFKVNKLNSFCVAILDRVFLDDELLSTMNKFESPDFNYKIENKIEFAFLYLYGNSSDSFLRNLNVYAQTALDDLKKIIAFIKNNPAIDRPITDNNQLGSILQHFKLFMKYNVDLKNQKNIWQKHFSLALEFEKYQLNNLDASILKKLDNTDRAVFKLSSFLKEYYEHQHHQKS